MVVVRFVYQFWMLIQGTSLALSFVRDLRNLTVVYKPNAFVYHLCETSSNMNFKRIRWHYESLGNSNADNDTDTHCKRLFNNSDCFDFYYGPSTSVLVVKEPDMYVGKYTCSVNVNSSYELSSTAWIDIKLPSNDFDNDDDDDENMGMYSERELAKLAMHYRVPFILDETDRTSFGKRIQTGGSFHSQCQSVPSSSPIIFVWLHLKNNNNNTSDSLSKSYPPLERTKLIRFVEHNGKRIQIQQSKYASSLSIHPVELADDGDYVCIASNHIGRSFSSVRSLIVSERMVLPRIRNNLLNSTRFDMQRDRINELICMADGYPDPEVIWIRVLDSARIARNRSQARLRLDTEMHGLNEYVCEAKNKHGLSKIFITVLIPDSKSKPFLTYGNLQERSVILNWRVSTGYYDRFNHFVIYYRRRENFDQKQDDEDDDVVMINTDFYKQVVVDPRATRHSFTFRITDLVPFTRYEFRLKGFIGATPSAYSNRILIKTLETIPDKIENLHGYVWNQTTIVVHWTPPNSTNGPNFYYVVYYTGNTSIPFDQWSNIVVRTYPFHIFSPSISADILLFIRIASVNAKGSTLSDFHIVNRSTLNRRLTSSIEKFQCSSDDHYPFVLRLEWTIDRESRLYIENYVLYYLDDNNELLARTIFIPPSHTYVDFRQSSDTIKYHLNTSFLELNFNQQQQPILRLHLTTIDKHGNQMPLSQPMIHCSLTQKFVPLVAPINVTVHMLNQTTANISWIYPLDPNNLDDVSLLGGMIKGFYVIVFAPDSVQPPIVHRNYEGTIGTHYWDIVGNLTPGTTYHAQVKAFTKKGDGKPSVAYIFTAPKEDFRQLAPSNLTAYVVSAHTLSVTWDLPTNVNAIDRVFITVIERGNEKNRSIQMQSFDNTIKKMDIQIKANDPFSIHPNRTVYFSARCSDRNGQNSSTTEYQLYVNMLNPSPRDIRVYRVNDTTIHVSWSPIYHPPVERYIVHYSDKAENRPENQWSLYSPPQRDATSTMISGLKSDAIYNVRVNAEFSSLSGIHDSSYSSTGTTRREGDLSEIYVADVYRRSQFITQYDDQLSRPYNMTYLDVTANSVKILFYFNETQSDQRRRIQKLEVHYEGIQNYVDGLGTARSTSHQNSAGLISIPATQGNREWLVTGLVPNTNYTLNLSGTTSTSDQSHIKVYSRPAMIRFSTDYDAPSYVDRPSQGRRLVPSTKGTGSSSIPRQFYLELHRASTKNGPIDRYYIVVHLIEHISYHSYVPQEGRRECCYTAAVFNESSLPDMFALGDGKETRDWDPFSGRVYNNSPLTSSCRVKLVSWGFNRKKENLTTSSSTFYINLNHKPVQTSNQDSFNNLLWIFGIIVLLFLIVIIVILFIFKYSRTRKKPLTPPPECVPFDLTPKVLTMEMQMPILPPTISPASSGEPVELRRPPPQSITASNTYSTTNHPPIHVDEFAIHLERLKAADNYKFSQEYESIDPGQQFSWENSKLECNKPKNRYANVVAYDHSRVILRPIDGVSGSDYINANYLDGYRKQNAFIATQGPLPDTFGDFWRMIWETNSACIVMMTKLEERNRLKCDQYWPTRGTEIYGPIQVTLTDLIELASYSVRTFTIAWTGHPEKREIRHCQFTAWPDHGIPEHSTAFLMFVRRVKVLNPLDAGPIVVHCSAGVGRTGCFIVLDALIERLKHEKTVDIYGHVTLLRAQRNYIVQTEEQYIFIYDAVNEAIQSGQTEVSARNLLSHLQRLLQPINDSSLTEMELEFKRLANVKAQPSKFVSANNPANKFKNRLVNILPYESTRVCLSPIRGVEGSDYVNASYIDGYRFKNGYIATQGPLTETIDDFWRMVWEHNAAIIVMLTKLKEMGREKCVQYWPTDRSTRYGYFIVDPVGAYNMPQYLLSEFKVTDSRDGQSRTVRHFLYTEWPEQGVPKVGEGFIDFIGQVHKTKEGFGQEGPIVVHCSAGVGRTGVFITLSIVLERIRYEGVVDVFQTVKLLRTQRPALVQTEDQYQFCYRSALEYLGSFDNFVSS